MHNRSSNRRRRPVLALLIALALLAPSVLANAQSEEPVDGAVTTVSLSMTIVELVDSGRIWIDAEGYHVRDAVTTALVEGDITGVAELVSGIDQYGPCSGPLDCDGEQETFSEIRIEGEDQIWSGQLALETASESGSPVHGMLVGRHGALDKIIVLDTLVGLEGDTLELAGNMVTLLGPTGGVHLTVSACITGPTTADGGFIGTSGLIHDSGPFRVKRQPLGGAAPTGVYGELRQIGQKGTLRGLFIANVNNHHTHGTFVLVGESGAYRGILGYGRATATVTEEPRCDSGLQVTSTWTGPASYIQDPDTFLPPRVHITSPEDGAVVSSPLELHFSAENVVIEPAGTARDGAGHFTIILDAPCIGPGEPIPDDDAHFQLVDGASTVNLSVFSGKHRLCLQLTDGNGIAQPATDVITIFVSASGGDELADGER